MRYYIIIDEHARSDYRRGERVSDSLIVLLYFINICYTRAMIQSTTTTTTTTIIMIFCVQAASDVIFFCKYFKLFVIMSKSHSGIYLQHVINTPYDYVNARVYPPIMQDPAPSISRDQSAVYRTSSAADYYVYYNISILEIMILFENDFVGKI